MQIEFLAFATDNKLDGTSKKVVCRARYQLQGGWKKKGYL